MADKEPVENIGSETEPIEEDWTSTGEEATRAQRVVDRLGSLYWRKSYGDRQAFACLVRTILSQNTSDKASQPAFDALMDRFGCGDLTRALSEAEQEDIAEVIQPAGLHNQKAAVLHACAQTIVDEFGSADGFDSFITSTRHDRARDYLLELDGVGPKTADCVLLFAGGADGVFPVDTHVYRIARRIGLAPPDAEHETVREYLESTVNPQSCGFGHTSMIQFGRENCTARHPVCLDGDDHCPLADLCEQNGIDQATATVTDPQADN